MNEWRICALPGCGFRYRPYTQAGRFEGCTSEHTYRIRRAVELAMAGGDARCGYHGCILMVGHDGLHDTGS